jgi:hypothetical protein
MTKLLVHGLFAESADRAENATTTRRSNARQADMISRKINWISSFSKGPGLRSATPRNTCASRSGRNTGALVSALT